MEVEGTHFGDYALNRENSKRSATVVTQSACDFLTLHKRDYNAILKKVTKHELEDKVALLDQVELFQNPVWTPDLCEELAYLLTKKKLGMNEVLYTQGEKANALYIVLRGEATITRELTLGTLCQKVYIDRLGPYQITGLES